MDEMKYMKQSSKKTHSEEEYVAMGKTHARRHCFCLAACHYMELHPEQLPDNCESVEEMHSRNLQMIAAWESLTEEHFAVISIANMEAKAARLKLDVYWEHPHGPAEKARRYEARLIKHLGCSGRAGVLAMPEPGEPRGLTVRAISQTRLNWVLFQWKGPREGGLIFGPPRPPPPPPTALCLNLGITTQPQLSMVNAVPPVD